MPERFVVILGDRGHVALPSELRKRLGLGTGDRLILTVEAEGGFRAMSARELASRLRGLYRDLARERALVDELLAERRDEVAAEEVS